MTFKGVNTIANNTGFDGGGVFLDSSYIAFAPQSKLHIITEQRSVVVESMAADISL